MASYSVWAVRAPEIPPRRPPPPPPGGMTGRPGQYDCNRPKHKSHQGGWWLSGFRLRGGKQCWLKQNQ